jgi:hypothetical protein
MLLLLASGERDLHPHDNQVVEVQTSPPVPEYYYSFEVNESHTLHGSGRTKAAGAEFSVICRRCVLPLDCKFIQ